MTSPTDPTVSVIVSTFGDLSVWQPRANKAIASACDQSVAAHEIIYNHGDTIEDTRNLGAHQAEGEWLCFLDADDTLDNTYIEEMTNVVDRLGALELPALVQPATLGVYPDGTTDPHPVVIPRKNSLLDGNWMVIGTLVPRHLFLRVGGFKAYPAWEDWELWIRCWIAGASFQVADKAVYRVGVSEDPSRNKIPDKQARQLFNQIRDEHLAAARTPGLAA